MNKNLASLVLTNEQLTTAFTAVGMLESVFTGLIELTPEQKKSAAAMGDKSEAFCRRTLEVLQQNPLVIPASMDLPDALADLKAVEQLRPLVVRLTQLFRKLSDTDLALRCDIMAMALQGYRLLKVTGRGAGLSDLQQNLGGRFAKRRRVPAEKPAQ